MLCTFHSGLSFFFGYRGAESESQEQTVFGLLFQLDALLRIEVDAVGYSNKHVAVCDPVALGHAHPDAVASRVDHGLEVSRGVDPVVDGVLGGVGCASEHSEVINEAVGISGLGNGLAFLRSVMPCIAPVGANLGGVHQGFVDGQFRYFIGLAGLVNQADHLLAYLKVLH